MIPCINWTATKPPAPLHSAESATGRGDGVRPDSVQELELRADFFREQWLVSGPGQLAKVVSCCGLESPAPITLRWTMPSQGDVGGCELANVAWCPAVLHDLEPELPETVRLTWVLATALVLQARETGDEDSCGPRCFAISPSVAGMVVALAAAESTGQIARNGNGQLPCETALRLWKVAPTKLERDWIGNCLNLRESGMVKFASEIRVHSGGEVNLNRLCERSPLSRRSEN